MRKLSIDLKVSSDCLLAVVGVDEDQIDVAEAGAPAHEGLGVGVSPEDGGVLRQMNGQATGLGVSLVGRGDPVEVEDSVQSGDQSPRPDADLQVAAYVVGLDELCQPDDLLPVLEDAVFERLVVLLEDGLGLSIPALEGESA